MRRLVLTLTALGVMAAGPAWAHPWDDCTGSTMNANVRIRKWHIQQVIGNLIWTRDTLCGAPQGIMPPFPLNFSPELSANAAGITPGVTPVRASHFNNLVDVTTALCQRIDMGQPGACPPVAIAYVNPGDVVSNQQWNALRAKIDDMHDGGSPACLPIGACGQVNCWKCGTGAQAGSCLQDNPNGTFTNNTCNGTCVVGPCGQANCYKCSAGSCVQDNATGTHATANCENACVPQSCTTPPCYKCNGFTCEQDDVNGTFVGDPTCASACTGCGQANCYKCSGAACGLDSTGGYTDANCLGTCTNPPGPCGQPICYKCSSGSCVRDDINGTFASSSCGYTCATKYKCVGAACAVDNVSGTFTENTCGGTCITTGCGQPTCYKCSGTSCVQDNTGGFADNNCMGTCGTPDGPCMQPICYKCNGTTCERDDINGTYSQMTCNGACSPTGGCGTGDCYTCNGSSCDPDINGPFSGGCGSECTSVQPCWCDSGTSGAMCVGSSTVDNCGNTCNGTLDCPPPCTCANGCQPEPPSQACSGGIWVSGCTPFGWSAGCNPIVAPADCNGSPPPPPASGCSGSWNVNCTPFGWSAWCTEGPLTCTDPAPSPPSSCSPGFYGAVVCDLGVWSSGCLPSGT